jgi:polyisoprenoid-binding protein YceI
MKSFVLAALLSATATMGFAAEKYTLDSSHSQVLFS